MIEIYHLLGMKSSRDDLIDRMKTGWGCFVLASVYRLDTVSLVGFLNPSSASYLLTGPPPPPLPCVNNYRVMWCVRGGIGSCGEHIQELYILDRKPLPSCRFVDPDSH